MYLSCIQREAQVDIDTTKSNTEFFKRLTTAGDAEETDQTKAHFSSEKFTVWSCNIQKHARKCVG